MVPTVLRNKRGSSLVELIIAMTILLVVGAALMKSSIIVLQKNVQNEMRDEAVRVAEQRMNEIRSGPGGFDNPNGGIDLVAGIATLPAINRIIRNVPVAYTPTKNVVSLDTNTKQVTVTVTWLFRGQQYSHAIMSIVRRYGS